jgi:post-segregation antitoxin (ccd killing protein)
MRMARMNIYLPDDLAEAARSAGLNVSGLTQEAVRRVLAVTRTDEWLNDLARLPGTGVTHEDVIAAIEHARDEFDRLDA